MNILIIIPTHITISISISISILPSQCLSTHRILFILKPTLT